MTSPTGTTRNLPYPLKNTEDMESVVGSETILNIDLSDWSNSDPDIKVPIILNLSLNEYVALASTVDVGRDIAYGDNSIYLWWLWVRSLESMTICDAIIDCINDDESGVMEAILQNITLTDGDSAIDNGQSQGDLIFAEGANPTCDYDTMWGGIESVINRANQNNLDVLQALEVATNLQEWVADVAGGLFGIELPVVQSLMDWAEFVQNSIMENYEAQITNEYLEELQCDLFCISQEQCELTPQRLVDYFYARLNSQLTIGSLLNETAQFILTGVWSGTEIADVMFLAQFAFRAQLGRWFEDIAFGSIDLDMRLGYTDANDNWELLCDTCQWESVLDFENVDLTSIIAFEQCVSGDMGVWVDGTGLQSVAITPNCQGLGIDPTALFFKILFDDCVVTEFEVESEMTRGGYSDTGFLAYKTNLEDDGVAWGASITDELASFFTEGVPTTVDSAITGMVLDPTNVLFVIIRPSNNAGDGICTVSKVTIRGTGTKPTQLP